MHPSIYLPSASPESHDILRLFPFHSGRSCGGISGTFLAPSLCNPAPPLVDAQSGQGLTPYCLSYAPCKGEAARQRTFTKQHQNAGIGLPRYPLTVASKSISIKQISRGIVVRISPPHPNKQWDSSHWTDRLHLRTPLLFCSRATVSSSAPLPSRPRYPVPSELPRQAPSPSPSASSRLQPPPLQ